MTNNKKECPRYECPLCRAKGTPFESTNYYQIKRHCEAHELWDYEEEK